MSKSDFLYSFKLTTIKLRKTDVTYKYKGLLQENNKKTTSFCLDFFNGLFGFVLMLFQ